MKSRSYILTTILAASLAATAQQNLPLASSHASTTRKPATTAAVAHPMAAPKPAVRVNGVVLTDADIVREMYTIFPYARQHDGFPKDMEPEIRKGATEMVIFEELLYQKAKARKMEIPAEKLDSALKTFRRQFADPKVYQQYLRLECNNSSAVLREKIRRSLLIEKMLKTEVDQKAVITTAAAKAFYDANAKRYEHDETYSFQTISIVPPDNASQQLKDEAKLKIKDAARLGKAAKTSRDFGVIAEQISEDDWRTKLGDRGPMEASKLPPEVRDALRKMKIGDVSDPIAVGTAWVVVRLNEHAAAGKTPFEKVKSSLIAEMQRDKRLAVRAELNKNLRKEAKIELL
jgi:hypothetical protein